ncbi:MAG TPA: DUF2231 domain-containing protein [Sphingomicrobium sp.]|nr:DUF2231 domain-containing protein [Sphingomicrobium sp.]
MATNNDGLHDHPRSTARIGGHPIHPMLIPFPIVCFIGALVTDIVFLSNSDAGWATASKYLLGIGIVMALLAALAGLTDFFGDKRIQGSDAIKHMLANVTAVVLEIVNFFVRLNNNDAIGGIGIILSVIVVLILLYSGWKGGDLVFKHGIGVRD